MHEKYKGATPGPWKCEGTINDEHVFTDDGIWICQLWGKDEENFTNDEETAANAELIADSPMLAEQNAKMLDMLKAAIYELNKRGYTGELNAQLAEIEGQK